MIDDIVASTRCQPRPYQLNITRKVAEMFSGNHKDSHGNLEIPASSVLIESPTGSGKTVMGHLVAKFLSEHFDAEIGWVAMRRNLLTQAEKENRTLGINVNNIHYVSMFDSEPEGLIAAKNRGKKIVMIVDEAQHDSASSMAHLHNLLEPSMILGLTATPFRTDRVKLCFDKVVKDAGIHQLIQDGWLSEYNHYTIDEWNPHNVFAHYMAEPERWGQSVVFFHEMKDCEEFYHLMLKNQKKIRKILAERRPDLPLEHSVVQLVRGGGNKAEIEERDEILEQFRNKNVGILVNCMVLTEGFDAPVLETAFVRDSSRGPTIQMGGRAFRKHHDLKFKNIVQSKHTKWPMIRTALPNEQYVWQNEEWRSLTVNRDIEIMAARNKIMMASTEVSIPSFILAKQQKKKPNFWDRNRSD